MGELYRLRPFNDELFSTKIAPAIKLALEGNLKDLSNIASEDLENVRANKPELIDIGILSIQNDEMIPDEISGDFYEPRSTENRSMGIPDFLLELLETKEIDEELTEAEMKLKNHLGNLTKRIKKEFNAESEHFLGYITNNELEDFKDCLNKTEFLDSDISADESDEVKLLLNHINWAIDNKTALMYEIG